MILVTTRAVLGGVDEPLRVQPAAIEMAGGQIAAIHSTSDLPSGVEVTDLGDLLVTPGFINGHTHLAMSAFRGIGGLASTRGNVVENLFFKLESLLSADDVRAFARIGAYEALLTGTTTVWEHYYHGRALADAIADVGITGVVSPTLQDLSGPGAAFTDRAMQATRALSQDANLARAGVVVAVGPHASDTVSDPLWDRIIEVAGDLDIPIHMHLAQSLEEYERAFARHGCSPLQHLADVGLLSADTQCLFVHALFVATADLALLDPGRHHLGHCPWSQQQFAFPADVEGWIQAGFGVVVGTDCGACNDTMNVQQELRLLRGARMSVPTWSQAGHDFRSAAGVQSAQWLQAARQSHYDVRASWLTAESLLSTVWSAPGRLHPALRQGAIEVGREANLVVFDPRHPALWPLLDPLMGLAMCDAAPAIDGVMVRGRWVGQRGDFHRSVVTSDGYLTAVAEAASRLDALVDKAGLT